MQNSFGPSDHGVKLQCANEAKNLRLWWIIFKMREEIKNGGVTEM